MNLRISQKEILIALAMSGVLYLVPAARDWVIRGMHLDIREIYSGALWLGAFYWGPMAILLAAKRFFSQLPRFNTWLEFPLYFLLMLGGISLVNVGLSKMFPGYSISLFDQVLSALLWGGFFYGFLRFWWAFKQLQQEKLLRKQAEFQALKSKLDPHFLFNSLNTISSFIHVKPDEADETLYYLSDVMRYSLETHEKGSVRLSTEVLKLQNYLAIEKARFGERLQVTFHIEQDCQDALIPPLLLQPLVENAIKHGKSAPLEVGIFARRCGNHLHLTVQDNGQGFSEQVLKVQQGDGQGLAITRQRVLLMENSRLSLKNTNGACVEIAIEFTTQAKEGEAHD